MLAKISKYTFEIVAGIVIFVVILYFLPTSNVSIPKIGDLEMEPVDLAFVVDETIPLEEIPVEEVEEPEEVIIIPVIDTGMIFSGEDADISALAQTYESCTTPWNTTIAHGDSVIAYRQRSDAPGICNIQRRVCADGVLNGSYEQSSCTENVGFNPRKQEVTIYNLPHSSEYIQPQSTSTTNTSSSGFTSAVIPGAGSTDVTNSGVHPFVTDYSFAKSDVPAQGVLPFSNNNSTSSSSSTVWDGTVCSTPWGEKVRNGQFIKAYKLDKGFSNLPCEVELRYCVQTKLQGSFAYKSCQLYDIAVEDYLVGHYDPNVPSAIQLAEILHGSAENIPDYYGKRPALWERISLFIKNIFGQK